MWSCLSSSRDERMREVLLLRSLGASARQLAYAQWFELIAIGFISGFIATGMAQLFAKIVALKVFGFDLPLSFLPLFIGGVIGATFSFISGTFALRGILSTPPIRAIREIS